VFIKGQILAIETKALKMELKLYFLDSSTRTVPSILPTTYKLDLERRQELPSGRLLKPLIQKLIMMLWINLKNRTLRHGNLRYGHDTSKSLAKVPCDKYRMRDDKAKQLRATPCGEIVFQIDDFKNHKRFITNL
jgi:hypothetical protein